MLLCGWYGWHIFEVVWFYVRFSNQHFPMQVFHMKDEVGLMQSKVFFNIDRGTVNFSCFMANMALEILLLI